MALHATGDTLSDGSLSSRGSCTDVSGSNESENPPQVRETLRMIVAIALPNIAGYVLNLVNELTNTVCLGHTGDNAALAAVGLGNMMQNCFGLSIGFGFSAALDLLVSKSFNEGNHLRSSHHLQRCRVLMTLNLIWMFPILYFSEPLLILIRQPREIAVDAGSYNRVTAIGLFFILQFEANRKFMQNCGWTKAPAVISFVCSLLHVFWCVLFVLYFDLGNAGAGLANVVTWVTEFVISSAYLAAIAPQLNGLAVRDVLWLSCEGACRGWSEYLSIAIPATIQICSEWWFWEVCALIIGYLGATSLAAHVTTINFVAVTFMPTIGINAATATLAGGALAHNKPRLAKQTVWVCLVLNFLLWFLLAALIVVGRAPLAAAYSIDLDVQDTMQWLLCIFAISGFADTTQNVMGGALRGIGLSQTAAVIYLVSFYLVMLPVGCILAFPLDLDVAGMYVSFLPGCGTAVLLFGWILGRVDWVELAKEASMAMEYQDDRDEHLESTLRANLETSLQPVGGHR